MCGEEKPRRQEGTGAAGGLGEGPGHLVAGIKCSITEAGDHVLHQGGAPVGETAAWASSLACSALTPDPDRGPIHDPAAGSAEPVCPIHLVLTLTRPAQGRAGASAALEHAPGLVSGHRDPPGARLHTLPSQPFFSLCLDRPVSGKVQAMPRQACICEAHSSLPPCVRHI